MNRHPETQKKGIYTELSRFKNLLWIQILTSEVPFRSSLPKIFARALQATNASKSLWRRFTQRSSLILMSTREVATLKQIAQARLVHPRRKQYIDLKTLSPTVLLAVVMRYQRKARIVQNDLQAKKYRLRYLRVTILACLATNIGRSTAKINLHLKRISSAVEVQINRMFRLKSSQTGEISPFSIKVLTRLIRLELHRR